MSSILPNPEVEPTASTASNQHLQPSTSGLELDLFYSGLELDRNVSGLEPVPVDYGPESTPAERHEQNIPQPLIGTEDKEVVEREILAGLVTVQKPNEDLPRKKLWRRLATALILVMILIVISVPVSVTQTRKSFR